MAQYRYAPLALRGKEIVVRSSIDHICNKPGCFKYIDAGEPMVRKNSHDLHLACAEKWAADNGVDVEFKEKV